MQWQELDDLMPMTKEEKAWVQNKIDEAVVRGRTPLPPTPVNTDTWIKRNQYWIALVLPFVILITGWATGIFGRALNNIIDDRIGPPIRAMTETFDRRFEGLQQAIILLSSTASNESDRLAIRVALSGSDPAKPENQSIAKQAIAEAIDKDIALPTSVIQQAGSNFIDVAATQDQNAWDVVLELFAFKSSQFALDIPTDAPILQTTPKGNFLPRVPGKRGPIVVASAAEVDPDRAARFENIGENLNTGPGSAFYFLTGGAINIDGKDIRGAIFVGVEIHYNGAPLRMDNVFFEKCTFVFQNTEKSREFGRTFLAATEGGLTFNTG